VKILRRCLYIALPWSLLLWSLVAAGSASSLKPVDQAPSAAAAKRNPLTGQESARRAGAKLFGRECAGCHGANAEGRGKAPSLIQPAVSNAAPGVLFWILRNGSIYHGMPSFAHLPEQQRWQLVTYLESLSSR
jgi:mono/diheme cytochrome c family protein